MSRVVEHSATAVAVGAMIATPFTERGGTVRRVLTTVTVTAGALRTFAVELREQGARRAATTAATAVAITTVAEAVGVRFGVPFGRYRYTDALRPTVAGVPLIVPAAWYAVSVPALVTADTALGPRSTRPARVALGALAMTAWDLFLDPQMTSEGYWHWSTAGRYRGIPARNFAGWALVSSTVMALADASRTRRSAPGSHLATYAGLAVLETLVFATFWRDRVVAVTGGAVMLPIAGLAIGRRGA
jgi:uncharacterized membrane protein